MGSIERGTSYTQPQNVRELASHLHQIANARDDKGQSLVKLDRHGLPLVPQPSDHPEDPLNWSYFKKWYVTMLVSTLAFVTQLGAALVNPAFVSLAADLHITTQQASYSLTTFVLFSGVTPMFISPLTNMYGRRIFYVTFTAVAVAANVGSGAAATYGGLITGRVFNGIGSSIPVGIGAASICDMFTQGERGLPLGFFALLVTNAPHISPIAGGFIAENLTWRWCYYLPAILLGFFWVLCIFTLPETLFSREDFSVIEHKTTYFSKMFFFGRVLNRPLNMRSFLAPFYMIKYVTVVLACCYYMTLNTYSSALFAIVGSHVFAEDYKFNLGIVGLIMGVPLTIGCMLGEGCAGWVSDSLINAYGRRHEGYRKPEVRLWLLPLCITAPLGTILFGVFVGNELTWVAPAMAMGIAGYGLQIGTTMVYTYCTDSYKPQSAEIGAIINLFKQIYAFNLGFYALPSTTTIGWGGAFGLFAGIHLLTSIPVYWLIFRGESLRESQGIPNLHPDT